MRTRPPMSFCTFLKMSALYRNGAPIRPASKSRRPAAKPALMSLEDGFSAREFRLHGLTHAIEHRRREHHKCRSKRRRVPARSGGEL